MPAADIATFYDQVPYPRLAYHYTHPDRMAVLGRLFGMRPRSVVTCRVLELGCAAGANLAPLAYNYPQAEFVGIDLSSRQIAEAQALAAALRLDNVRFEQLDLRELGNSFGTFDYIIAHGLYSWIPQSVQPHVLELCGKLLEPQGIAYISYNAYPGCHLRRMLRGMAMFHVRRVEEPRELAAQVRGLVEFLASMARPADSAYAAVLKDLQQTVAHMSDSGLVHELLEAHHHPVLFHDFIRAAEAAGLQYLTESTFADRTDLNVAPDVRQRLNREHGEIGGEQYLDFLNGQSFRRTLLCRRDVTLDRDVRAEQVDQFLVASSARPASPDDDLTGDRAVRFTTLHGVGAGSHRPVVKLALALLAQVYPRAIPFPQVCQQVGERMGRSMSGDEIAALRGELLGRFMLEKEVVEFRLAQPDMVHEAGPRPLASPIARYQAERGWPMVTLTHKMAPPPDANTSALLQLLDGDHIREELIQTLSGRIAGDLHIMLANLARQGLLAR